ncbi:hypothetical protein [Methanolobus profundi]|uniref:Uncharacterized protein n=1 Tax=Methanolobus profundi TaxID=487685 RepID=A0A1I4PBB0_9EURY|nr:hypothetical protein [Methanolobus profundi]SFM25078.1 hypothetical protein SAMN04488696_0555 [Methanolobus profundi]
MNCSKCNYRKHIPLFSKCAGVQGRARVGTAYYCGHPEMMNPTPVIPTDGIMPEDCPVTRATLTASENMQDTEVTG